MKKILFNCTTNVVGGGVKNSAIFISYAVKDEDKKYFFAISVAVYEVLKRWRIDCSEMYVFENSPAKSKKQRSRLKGIVENLGVDVVFTMAGPAYVKFSSPHVMGISNPYVTHADLYSYRFSKSWAATFKKLFSSFYQAVYSRRADSFIFQTETSRRGFCKRLLIDECRTHVVNNAIGEDFVSSIERIKKSPPETKLKDMRCTILCPAAPYPHKAIHLIPEIAKELKKSCDKKFIFLLTVNQESDFYKNLLYMAKCFGVSAEVETLGTFNYADVAKLYAGADIVFVPSILETFSASYLEAFASSKPLIVSDRSFSKDVCGDAALYVNVKEIRETAYKISKLMGSPEAQALLVRKGRVQLTKYGGQKSRYEALASVLNSC